MATIQKRKTGSGTSYRVLVRRKGYPVQSATFPCKADAKIWAENTETSIREGRYFSYAEARKHTVCDLIDRYSREVLARKEPVKRRDQERHLAWWRERLSAFSLADVSPSLLVECRTELAGALTVRGGKRSPATVNRYMASLSHAFAVAVREWQWLESNPVGRVSKLRESRGRVRFLSDDERERLLEACKASSERRLYPLVVLAISTGARRGELLGLRWSDVKLGSERGSAVLHETKNSERRSLPISGLALELLTELGRVRRLDTDLIFAGQSGEANFPRRAWKNALTASQIDEFRFHDLRHTAASYLAMNGATLAELAAILGHKTLAMVQRYSHLTEQHTGDVVARMNQSIFGASK